MSEQLWTTRALVGAGAFGVAVASFAGWSWTNTTTSALEAQVRELSAQTQAAQSLADESEQRAMRAEADLDMAHEVMTQSAFFYEDGSGVVTVWHGDGADGVEPTDLWVCLYGEPCDDTE